MSIDICRLYRMHITVYHNIICTSTLNQWHESTHAMIWHTEKGRVLQTWHISYNIIPEATAHPIFALLSLVLWQGPEGCQHLIVQSYEGALVVLLASMLGSGGVSSHRSLKEFASCQGCPGALLFVLHSIFNLFISFHSPFLEFLGCFVSSCQSGVGMGWRNTLCFVSCAALAVVSSKVEGKVSRSNSIPLKCHCTSTRGKQPKNTLWDPLPAIYGLQCLQKNTSMDKNKKSKWRNDWQKHKNKITGSFAQNLL